MLEIKNLSVEVKNDGEEKPRQILDSVNLTVANGQTVALLGPNGSGKSTIASVIMGNPKFKIIDGEIKFNNENLSKETISDRSKNGIFVSSQNPIEIPGISTTEMLYTALNARDKYSMLDVRARIAVAAKKLGLDIWFAEREMNVGMSGGERKKNEVLQILVLRPELVILDEIDSGLDIDSCKIISKAIADLQKETKMAVVVITHNMKILADLMVDKTYILRDGKILVEGDKKLVELVSKMGFDNLFQTIGAKNE